MDIVRGSFEDVPQQDVHDVCAALGDLPAAVAGPMGHAQPVFLDFDEFLVEVQDFGWFCARLELQPLVGVLPDFVVMARLGGHVFDNKGRKAWIASYSTG